MSSYTEYYKSRLQKRDKEIVSLSEIKMPSILGKRKYKEAMGYENDYLCVQEPNKEYLAIIKTDNKIIWKDAYSEQRLKL